MDNLNLPLERYKSYCIRQGLGDQTIASRIWRVSLVIKECQPLTHDSFERFLLEKAQEKKSKDYLNTIISNVLEFCAVNGIDIGTVEKFRKEKSKNIRATFNPDELEMMMNVPKPKGQTDDNFKKFNCFWRIAMFCGARLGEIASLSVSGQNRIDLGNGVIYLGSTKTGFRTVPIPELLNEYLTEYINNLKTDLLFPQSYKSATNRIITNKEWGWDFKSRLRRCGINRVNLVPNSFRHTYITLGGREMDVYSLMAIVGHKDPRTTLNYIHNDIDHLKQAANKHPNTVKYSGYDSQVVDIRNRVNDMLKNRKVKFDLNIEQNDDEAKIEIIIKR